MSDIEKLNEALCQIVTQSKICKDCSLRHDAGEDYNVCFFACECIVNQHKHYMSIEEQIKKGWNENENL